MFAVFQFKMSQFMSEVEQYLKDLRTDIWHYKGPAVDIDGVQGEVTLLNVQLKVQKLLQSTTTALRQHRNDVSLPKHRGTRVKHFLKYVFEETDHEKEKQMQLRSLSPEVLILWGLSFKVKEVYDMPSAQFDFLVSNLADYIRGQKISHHLCRDDVDRAIYSKFEPEDTDAFMAFLDSMLTSPIQAVTISD